MSRGVGERAIRPALVLQEERPWFAATDSHQFLGAGDLIRAQIPLPTAESREMLRSRELPLPAAELCLRAAPANRLRQGPGDREWRRTCEAKIFVRPCFEGAEAQGIVLLRGKDDCRHRWEGRPNRGKIFREGIPQLLQMQEDEWFRWSVEHRQRVSGLTDEEFDTLYQYLVANFNPERPVPELPPALLESWTSY